MGGARPSGRLGFAARPDQLVRSVVVPDQAGINRCRERRIVDGQRQIIPPDLAGFLQNRAEVVAGYLKAEVRGALVLALVVANHRHKLGR